MQDRIAAGAAVRIQFEDGARVIAASSVKRGAVKRAIAALDEGAVRGFTIVAKPGEPEQDKVAGAVGVNFENRAVVVSSPKESRPVEHTVPALQKGGVRVGTIPAAETEMVQDTVAA